MPSVSELNKRRIGRFIDDVWNQGRLELIDELVALDYVGHFSWLPDEVVGPDGLHRLVAARREAHPGLYIKIEDQIAEYDLVVTRWRAIDLAGGGCSGISVIRFLAGKPVDSHTAATPGTRGIAA